jgi:fimbrial chaperone protein
MKAMKRMALLLAVAGWAAGCAHAQGLTLSPVMLSAPAEGGATSLTIQSDLDQPKLVQVRVFDWSQADGAELMLPAKNVRFGPEIFEIAPGKSQTVRFSLPNTDGAGTWRVVVDELPPSTAPETQADAQLALRLRYVLSMFAGPAGAPEQLQARRAGRDIELVNPGPGWLKLHNVALVVPGAEPVAAGGGIVYLLPGAQMRLTAGADAASFVALEYAVGAQAYAVDLRPLE